MEEQQYKLFLLLGIIVLLFFQVIVQAKLITKEGLLPWDTGDARFQQEDDSYLGATESGDSLRMKQARESVEGLTGGYESPEYKSGTPSEVRQYGPEHERTENTLENSLHGS